MREPSIQRIEGRVPHTVISLPSGRTLAFGDNPDKANAQQITAQVDAMARVVMDVERAAQAAGGAVSQKTRADALEKIAAAQAGVRTAVGTEKGQLWARIALDRMHGLVFTIPTR